MGYPVAYAAGDISGVTIDLLVGAGAAIFSFASLVALIVIWKFLKNKTGM